MPWNGSGTYALPPAYSPEVNGTTIDATRYNGLTNDVATGISAALAKNGENVPTANLPMGGFKHTGAASATASGQYLTYGQNLGTIVADLGAVTTPSYTFTGDLNNGWWSPAADTQAWSIAGAELMRLNSTGLGIGMTPLGDSAGYGGKTFEIAGAVYARQSNDTTKYLSIGTSGGVSYLEANGTANQLAILTAGGERVRIDTSGRVGLNVVPQSWGATRAVIEIGGASDQSYLFGQNSVNLHNNVYYDGTNFRSVRAAVGGVYQLTSNTHVWFSASNGGVNGITTLTQTMTIDGSGQLGLGMAPIGDSASYGGKVIDVAGPVYARQSTDTSKYLSIGTSAGTSFLQANGVGNQLVFTLSGAEYFRMTNDGRLFGKALHNNAGAVTGTANQYIASGTYTPTGTSVANIAASTMEGAQWMRVGNVVTVTGSLLIQPTAAVSTCTLGLSLPIASNLAAASDAAGVAVNETVSSNGATMQADTTNDRVNINFAAANTSNQRWYYTYTYEVL